jgi:L-ascorbate metabolism protein UlaG (beta-lactamase superfamily)
MIDNIDVFLHSSIRIKSDLGTIYIDPFQISENYGDADYVFITHQHYDHFSPDDIRKVIGDNTILVTPESMIDDAMELEREVSQTIVVAPGVYREIGAMEVETVPAYNNIKPFHPRRAEWVGYILKIDGKRIYIAGDTGVTREAKQVKCDIALVPIGGTYTMDARKAAELINTIRPEVAIPTHYGTIVGRPSDAKAFAELVKPPVRVIEKIKF